MTARRLEGNIVLLDCEIGAIYQYTLDEPKRDTLEDRVGRHIHNIPDYEEWPKPGYKYAPFVPASEWFDNLYQRHLTLRKLPFLDQSYEGDRDMDLADIGPKGDWHRDLIERKQDTMVNLFEKHGWPDMQA